MKPKNALQKMMFLGSRTQYEMYYDKELIGYVETGLSGPAGFGKSQYQKAMSGKYPALKAILDKNVSIEMGSNGALNPELMGAILYAGYGDKQTFITSTTLFGGGMLEGSQSFAEGMASLAKYYTAYKANFNSKVIQNVNVSGIISKDLRTQKQLNEHTLGGTAVGTNSYLKTTTDAQLVIDAAFNSTAKVLSTNVEQNRVYVEYKGVTGYYNNNGKIITTNKFLIKGVKSATVVPIHPNSTTFK